MTTIIFLQRIDGVTVGGGINSWNGGAYCRLLGGLYDDRTNMLANKSACYV